MKRQSRISLLVALLLSVAAHAVTLTGQWLQLPQEKKEPSPLLARLQPVAPTPLPAPQPQAQQLPPRAAKAAPRPRPTAPQVAAAPAALKLDAPAPWTPPAAVAEAETETPEAMAQPEAPAPVLDPVVVANAAPSTFMPEPAAIKTLPKRGRISYALNYYMSDQPTLVGRTVQTWEASQETYTLDSHSETVGLARILAARFGPRTYHSSGRVTERGLQPRNFTSKVVMRGNADDSAAHFDWSKNELQFGRAADRKNTPLPAGSQDLLSFIYQFSLAPPPKGRLQLPITNGVRFESYDIDVLDEEIIETPLGQLRTLPIKQVRRQGRESIEVWLAAEYQYLPVRILIVNRDGTRGGEQVATEISIGEK